MGTSSGRQKTGPRRGGGGKRPRKRQVSPLRRGLLLARDLGRRGLRLTWDLGRRGLRLAWHLAPLLAVILVALALFVLDPTGLAMLVWSCVTGAFGAVVQVCVSALLVSGAALLAWAFWPETQARAQPKRRANTAATRRARPRPDPEAAVSPPPGGRRRAAAQSAAMPAAADGAVPTAAASPTLIADPGADAAAASASATPQTPRRAAAKRRKAKPRVPRGGEVLAGQQAGD